MFFVELYVIQGFVVSCIGFLIDCVRNVSCCQQVVFVGVVDKYFCGDLFVCVIGCQVFYGDMLDVGFFFFCRLQVVFLLYVYFYFSDVFFKGFFSQRRFKGLGFKDVVVAV